MGSEALNVTIFLRQSLDGSVAPYEHSREFLTHLEQQGLASSHYNMLSFMLQETWVELQLLPDKSPECWVDQGHRSIISKAAVGRRPKEGGTGGFYLYVPLPTAQASPPGPSQRSPSPRFVLVGSHINR